MSRAEEGGCAKRLCRLVRAAWRSALAASMVGPFTGAVLVVSSVPLLAQTAEQAQKTAQDVIRGLDLQTELPHEQLQPPPTWHFNVPQEVLWVVVVIAVGILLYAFRDLIPAWRADAGAAHDEEGGTGEEASGTPGVILEAADELAARGRFVEAMHVLLLHGLAHIRQRLDLQFSDSLTSREILRNRALPDAARTSLRDVVARVELTYFGLQPAGAADYAACRQSFHALERALQGGASA